MKQFLPIRILIVSAALALVLIGGFIHFTGVRSLSAENVTARAQAGHSQKSDAGVNSMQPAFSMDINCGQVNTSRGVLPSATALDSAICFQFAFESCDPAQIALHEVDTGITRTFVTGKQGTRCYIILTTRFSGASKGPDPAPMHCSNEAMHQDGLHISGCDGQDDIVIPAAQPDQHALAVPV